MNEEQEAQAFARVAALPLISAGFLAPVPFAVAARRTRRGAYTRAAWFWLASVIACIACFVLGGHGTIAGAALAFLNMCGATVHALAIRRGVAHELTLAHAPELVEAQRRADLRRRAHQIASREPARALELGIGRPDLDGAFDGGLIDVNHAPVEVLMRLPGVDRTAAQRIAELRAGGTGFTSADDLDAVLDLEPGLARELAARAVFLPR